MLRLINAAILDVHEKKLTPSCFYLSQKQEKHFIAKNDQFLDYGSECHLA